MTAPTLGLLPALSPTVWTAVAVVVLLLAAVTWICVVRARRLDHLHRRTDAARAGLADALDRRGAVALRVADAVAAPDLRTAAHASLDACRTALRSAGSGMDPCEVAENTLTRRLAGVDRSVLPAGLAAELVDAEQSVLIARRVHNDAVRDTLDLRSRRLVRWLRLAGTAPVPSYFEIADPQPWQPPAAPAPTSPSTVPPPADPVPGVPA